MGEWERERVLVSECMRERVCVRECVCEWVNERERERDLSMVISSSVLQERTDLTQWVIDLNNEGLKHTHTHTHTHTHIQTHMRKHKLSFPHCWAYVVWALSLFHRCCHIHSPLPIVHYIQLSKWTNADLCSTLKKMFFLYSSILGLNLSPSNICNSEHVWK